ncbi:hypothetical protein AJOOGB_AJOOGB_10020, partial [Dysosmobacter welbionis]
RGAAVLRRLMGRRPAPSSCAEIRLQHSGAAVGGGELTVHQIPHLFHCPQGQQGVRQCPEGQGQIRLLRQTRQSRRGQVYIARALFQPDGSHLESLRNGGEPVLFLRPLQQGLDHGPGLRVPLVQVQCHLHRRQAAGLIQKVQGGVQRVDHILVAGKQDIPGCEDLPVPVGQRLAPDRHADSGD